MDHGSHASAQSGCSYIPSDAFHANFIYSFAVSCQIHEDLNNAENQQYAADSASGGGRAVASCKVCGDRASGYHYGVTSCEGCKGFFRRSIQKQIEYRCLRDGKCQVIRHNRNRCQFCRFRKCLVVGMSKDSVRYGRVPKRTRESVEDTEMAPMRKNARPPTVPAPPPSPVEPQEPSATACDFATDELIRTITRVHAASGPFSDDDRAVNAHLTERVNDAEAEAANIAGQAAGAGAPAHVVVNNGSAFRRRLWEQVAILLTPAITQIVHLINNLPRFKALSQDDKLILVKHGFFEVWLTRVSRVSTANYLVFEEGISVSLNQLATMYDRDFAIAIMEYVWRLAQFQLNDEELSTYSSCLVMSPTRPQLQFVDAIGEIHLALTEAFRQAVLRSGRGGSRRLEALWRMMERARGLGDRHNELLVWARERGALLSLPPLFAELFDIPTRENIRNAAAAAASEAAEEADAAATLAAFAANDAVTAAKIANDAAHAAEYLADNALTAAVEAANAYNCVGYPADSSGLH